MQRSAGRSNIVDHDDARPLEPRRTPTHAHAPMPLQALRTAERRLSRRMQRSAKQWCKSRPKLDGGGRGDHLRMVDPADHAAHEWCRHGRHDPPVRRPLKSAIDLARQRQPEGLGHIVPTSRLHVADEGVERWRISPEPHEPIELRRLRTPDAPRRPIRRPPRRRALPPLEATPAPRAPDSSAADRQRLAHRQFSLRTPAPEHLPLEQRQLAGPSPAPWGHHCGHIMKAPCAIRARRRLFSACFPRLRPRPSCAARTAGCRRGAGTPPRPVCPHGTAP